MIETQEQKKEKAASLHGQVKVMAKDSEIFHTKMLQFIDEKDKKINEVGRLHKALQAKKKEYNDSTSCKLKLKKRINRSRGQLQEKGISV